MSKKQVGIKKVMGTKTQVPEKTYRRPAWVESGEEWLCADCFKVVGNRNRYRVVCMLGKKPDGMNVTAIVARMKLTQPTVTHHLAVLASVDAVRSIDVGRQRVYTLNRAAHCFEECKIPY